MKKPIVISVVAILTLLVWYFFAPIKWTFGIRPPKDFDECIKAGGRIESNESGVGFRFGDFSQCTYKNQSFSSYINI